MEALCMAGQGRYLSGESIHQIVELLASTEMSMSEIAERMAISKTTVVSINRKFQVRKYDGLRTRWAWQGMAEKKPA
jgi:hypothetical protein